MQTMKEYWENELRIVNYYIPRLRDNSDALKYKKRVLKELNAYRES